MSNVIDFQAFKDNRNKSNMAKAFRKADDTDTRSERVRASIERINERLSRLGCVDYTPSKERR